MLRQKQEYSEAKTAYDARSPEEVAAANKAVEEAAAVRCLASCFSDASSLINTLLAEKGN